MRKRMVVPAGTPCKEEVLRRTYRRQFRETASLRRHILSLLPLNRVKSVFEPGCGTGLLGQRIISLTEADYTGMDMDGGILPDHPCFVQGNAEANPPAAELCVSSFFFSSLNDPEKWLKKLQTEYFAVFGEYDYTGMGENPDRGVGEKLRRSLLEEGFSTLHGARLPMYFKGAGYVRLNGGELRTTPRIPDREFLSMHIEELPELLPLMTWRIVWGIWRKTS